MGVIMIDSDGDIYRQMKKGVDVRVIAELNACSSTEIVSAASRYERYLKEGANKMSYEVWLNNGIPQNKVEEKKKVAKTKVLDETKEKNKNKTNSPAGSAGNKKGKVVKKQKRQVYRFTEEQNIAVKNAVIDGIPCQEVYKEMFEGKKDKPSAASFSNKYHKIRKQLGIELRRKGTPKKQKVKQVRPVNTKKEFVVPSYLTGGSIENVVFDEKNKMIKTLQEHREVCVEKVKTLEISLSEAIYDLAQVDLIISQLGGKSK